MHRTQLLLEEWQYEVLKALSEQEGRSISAIVRGFLDKQLNRRSRGANGGLRAIEGIVEAPESYGRRHDEALYGKK